VRDIATGGAYPSIAAVTGTVLFGGLAIEWRRNNGYRYQKRLRNLLMS
jgi:hypothetical protein